MANLKKIISKFNPIATKMEYSNGYYSVLVTDNKQDINLWVDLSVENKDVSCDWNKYIFYLDDPKDVFIRSLQEDCNVFDLCCSVAVEYLERQNKIHQDDNGFWFETKEV